MPQEPHQDDSLLADARRWVHLVVEAYHVRYESSWEDRIMLAMENAGEQLADEIGVKDFSDSDKALAEVCRLLNLNYDDVWALIYQ